jgi:hypothetical protein
MVDAPPAIAVRPYRRSDRAHVRAIVCATAFRNRGHHVMLGDADLFADYWSSYYTDHEPESCMVAERDGVVVGYLFGCVDSRRYQRTMARAIVPSVLRGLVARTAGALVHGRRREWRLLRWLLLRAWREAPPVDLVRYPAHYHLNLLRAASGERLYTRMAIDFLRRAEAQGARGVHGQVLERLEHGVWQRLVRDFRRQYPHVVVVESSRESTMEQALDDGARGGLSDERPPVRWANRAYAATIPDFVAILEWMRTWRRL